ncbi:MAG: VCBS repeat-containing protein, partial [Chloroflexota bacterium]
MRVYLLLILLALFVTFSPISSHRVQADEPEIFVDVSQSVGINATHRASWNEFSQVTPFTDGYLGVGQAWGDYDNDGWVDLYVTGNLDQNHLYKNLGDGTFQLSNLSSSVSIPDIPSGGAVWSDYDNDGWRDLYVLNHGANVLFRNIEGNAFEDVTAYAGIGDTGKG